MTHYTAHEQIGYYQKDVLVFVTKRLSRMPYAQAGVKITDNGEVLFYSYSSLVAILHNDGSIEWGFDANPDYSRSTIRQFSAFLQEYAPWYSYHQWKEDDKNGKKVATR